ncbi:tetratricopeptide repeat protein [Luteibacter sp.]|uniref:tetratricopeptide repeat protein n=2 Tax=Luteibacter sp. TaxID=1886636 RepID=UPI002809170E|nr:tetratricopeptide repeat protein [Luteibacter sp.]MDQ8049255.1 tetratricopeptide repeat protein [Luteibacter sp.]
MFGFFRKRKKAAEAPAAAPANDGRMVSFVDTYGRSYQIPFEQWRREVLQPNLQSKWDEPDALYSLVISALGDDLASDVDAASAHLLEIDPMIERGFVTRAIVQLKLGRTRDAKGTLRKAIDKVGETPTLLTNLAKVASAEGNDTEAMAILDRSLQLDPNQDNGLGWRVAERTEVAGPEAADAFLRALAERDDAFRPQLLLGQTAIQAGLRDDGLAWFDRALAKAPHGTDVMLAVTGTLGQHGLLNDLVTRVAPLFDPQRDDVRVGFNLLQAYVELGDAERGQLLLGKLFALGQPAYAQNLQHFAQAFDEMTVEPSKPLDHTPEISLLQMVQPPWLLDMHGMEWAAPPRSGDGPRIVLLPLAAVDDAAGGVARSGREDDRGRLSRALPLLLLEQLVYCSDLRVAMNLPVADQHNFVLFGQPLSDDELDYLGQDFDLAVEGEVSAGQDGFNVVCRLRRLSDRVTLKRVERRFNEREVGNALVVLSGELLASLAEATGAIVEPRVPMYALPGTDVNEYVSGLAQYLALTLASVAKARETLFGERNIYGWLQTLAVSVPDSEPAQFMYFTALGKGRRMGSPLVDEFEKPAVQRMRELVQAGRFSTRLLPLLAAVYPNNAELGDLLASAKPTGDEAYAAWCARVAAAFPVEAVPPSRE